MIASTEKIVIPAKVVPFKDRKATDVGCASLFAVTILVWLGIGIYICTAVNFRFVNPADLASGITLDISDSLLEDLQQCCENNRYGDLCEDDAVKDDSRRALSVAFPERFLERRMHSYHKRILRDDDDDTNTGTLSSFPKEGGMFDAFGESVEIPVTLIMMCVALAVFWVFLLRQFAQPIVFATKGMSVLGLVWFAAHAEAPFFYLVALCYLCFIVFIRKRLVFCAKVISHSALALKENPTMFFALLSLKLLYVLQAFLYILFITNSVQIYRVNESCGLSPAAGVGTLRWIISAAWMWSISWYSQMRLAVISTSVASWHFEPSTKWGAVDSLKNAFTKSQGAVAFSSLVLAIIQEIKRRLEVNWKQACGLYCITGGAFLPVHFLLCVVGWCLNQCLKMLTKFTLIIHCITGNSFMESAKLTFNVMTRHFVNAFITDSVSATVLALGSFVFAMTITAVGWLWIDEAYGWKTFYLLHTCPDYGHDKYDHWSEDHDHYSLDEKEDYDLPDHDHECDAGSFAVAFWCWLVFISVNVYNPVLGLFFLILIDMAIRGLLADEDGECGQEYWVAPLAAAFIGCISRMFFNYVAGIFMDTIEVCFVCWAIDKDNDVDLSNSEFSGIVMAMPGIKKEDGTVTTGMSLKGDVIPVAPAPVQPGAFVPPANPNAGSVEMVAPGQGFAPAPGQPMMMPMAQGQPMMMPMAQGQPMMMPPANGMVMAPGQQMQPMQPMQMPMANGQPMMMPMANNQPMVMAQGQPVQMPLANKDGNVATL
jgi:hypothetical protein